MEEKKTVSIREWIITCIVIFIPFVNLIALIIWLFSTNTPRSKKNWLIAIIIIGFFIFFISLPFFTLTGAMIKKKAVKYTKKIVKEMNEAYTRSIETDDLSFIDLAKQEKAIMNKQNKKYQPETKIDIPDHNGYLIAVYKEKHKIKLYKDNKVIKIYPVNLRSELADRRVWRDDQTPEGIFYIEDMAVVTNGWNRWMRLNTLDKAKNIYIQSYNNGEKIINAYELKYGEIKNDQDIRDFNRINPRQKMLRGIGIHGGGFIPGNDWTVGCIALHDKDVIELYNILINSRNGGIGVKVIIQD